MGESLHRKDLSNGEFVVLTQRINGPQDGDHLKAQNGDTQCIDIQLGDRTDRAAVGTTVM